jgi:hypothetical protein
LTKFQETGREAGVRERLARFPEQSQWPRGRQAPHDLAMVASRLREPASKLARPEHWVRERAYLPEAAITRNSVGTRLGAASRKGRIVLAVSEG